MSATLSVDQLRERRRQKILARSQASSRIVRHNGSDEGDLLVFFSCTVTYVYIHEILSPNIFRVTGDGMTMTVIGCQSNTVVICTRECAEGPVVSVECRVLTTTVAIDAKQYVYGRRAVCRA